MASITTPAETATPEPPTYSTRNDNPPPNLETIDTYIQERVTAAIDAEMKLRVRNPSPPKQILHFQDAMGRKFNFPFHIAKQWAGGMEHFINEAFESVQLLNELVRAGYYDLMVNARVLSSGEWEAMVRPGMYVTMHMWPVWKLAAELRGQGLSDAVVPVQSRTPTVCADSRSWVVKDCDDGVEEEGEELERRPIRKRVSRLTRLARWWRELGKDYDREAEVRHLAIARLDLVNGVKASDFVEGKTTSDLVEGKKASDLVEGKTTSDLGTGKEKVGGGVVASLLWAC